MEFGTNRFLHTNFTRNLLGIYSFLFFFNAASWLWAFWVFRRTPLALGTSLLAYSFGLRHAVDADHIAAIDNVTRKLMQEGKRPISVGLMFSLGHSTVVLIGAVLIASSALTLDAHVIGLRDWGSKVGTLISVFFLFSIALLNIIVLRSIYCAFVKVLKGGRCVEGSVGTTVTSLGFLSRVLGPMFRIITESWHMYPLGALFGLGFDTATEIGVLGISAMGASRGLPLSSILVFPTLFAAGMSLIDTTDNILMVGAYGWAFANPMRKLYYNLTVTSISVLVALAVGGIEAGGLVVAHFHLSGRIWNAVGRLNDNFTTLGCVIVVLFAMTWLLSVAIYKWCDFGRIRIECKGRY